MSDMSMASLPFSRAFGERLKQARLDQHLSQSALAQQLGIGRSTLVEYESGATVPSLVVAIRLAESLNVSLDWLCGLNPLR